jgi:hypothetical protein
MKTYIFRIGETLHTIMADSFSAARNELKRRLRLA